MIEEAEDVTLDSVQASEPSDHTTLMGSKQICAVVIALATAGCGESTKDQRSGKLKFGAPKPPIKQASEPEPPPIDEPWSPIDYVAFDRYIASLPHTEYPRISNGKSAAIFMKVLDSVEQPVFTQSDLDFDQRFESGLQMQQAINNVLKRYYSAHIAGTDYSTELIHLQGVTLSVSRQVFALSKEFLREVDPDDEKMPVRLHGLQRVEMAAATQLNAVIISLQEPYSTEQRRILTKYLADEAPGILDHLSERARREFEREVRKVHSRESDHEIKKLLAKLLARSSQN